MLRALNTGLRFRIAIALAAFAALSLVAPPAVMAFGHGDNTAHCLANADKMNHGMTGADHAKNHAKNHAEDHAKDHGTPTVPARGHQSNCCGLFCLSALTVDGGEIPEAALVGAQHGPAPEPSFLSQTPDCPHPPPILSLSV